MSLSVGPAVIPSDDEEPFRSDHDSDSDPASSHSLWPSVPDLNNIQPLSALSRPHVFKYTYIRDKQGIYNKVPIPDHLQRPAGMFKTDNLPPPEIPQMPAPPKSEKKAVTPPPPPPPPPPLENLYKTPPPWSTVVPRPISEAGPESDGPSTTQPTSLIPPIASIQESGPSTSRHPPPRFFLKSADWSEKGKDVAPHHLDASSSRQISYSDGPDAPQRTSRKRKAGTDEDHLARAAAGSFRHFLPPPQRDSYSSISNMRTSSVRFSAMHLEDDEAGSADDELEESEHPSSSPPPPPPQLPPAVPRIIRRGGPPQVPPSDDEPDDDEDEFDPTSGQGPKKKRKAGRFKCPESWCKETFTRRNDVTRHLKNAAVHRSRDGNAPGDSDKRCKFCNADLSRSDARARHERAGACGKRTFPRKDPKGGKRIVL